MRRGLRTHNNAESCDAACPPQPQTSIVSQSSRARYFAATAVAAAVRIAVIEIESMMASGRPFAASNRITAPWIVGSSVLPGKFALTLAAK